MDILHWSPNIGSQHGTTTFFTGKDGKIYVKCGCFFGSLEEFEQAVEKEHGDNKYGREYNLAIALAKEHIVLQEDAYGAKENPHE